MRCVHVKLFSYIVVLHFLVNATLWTTAQAGSHDRVQDGTQLHNRTKQQAHSRTRGTRNQGILHGRDRTPQTPQITPNTSSTTTSWQRHAKRIRPKHLTTNASQPVNRQNAYVHDSSPSIGPFLIPLLPFGLSNQILALKEALALAAVLNWTVVALGFWPHSSELAAAAGLSLMPGGKANRGLLELDAAGDVVSERTGSAGESSHQHQHQHQLRLNASSVIPFDTVFDRKALAPLVRVINREEAVRQYGWFQSGRVDVLLSVSPTSGLESTLDKAHQAELLDAQGVRIVRNYGFSCNTGGLSWLSRAAAGHRWVALYSYRRVVPAGRSSYRGFKWDSSPCSRSYHQVSLHMKKSPLITSTARSFVARALAKMQEGEEQRQLRLRGEVGAAAEEGTSGDGPGGNITTSMPYYIALHVRPYPDSCLDHFANMSTFDLDTASPVCSNPRLLLKMVPLLRQLLEVRIAADAAVGKVWSPNGTWALSSSPGSTLDAAGADIGPAAGPISQAAPVFVMSHPRVREVLRRELSRLWDEGDGSGAPGNGSSGGTPPSPPVPGSPLPPPPVPPPLLFFLNMPDLPLQLRAHVASTSLLSMVEQQVCSEAAAFVGTKASSISVLVAQERGAKDEEDEEDEEGEEGEEATVADEAEGPVVSVRVGTVKSHFGAAAGDKHEGEARRGGSEEGGHGSKGVDDRGDGVNQGHQISGQPGKDAGVVRPYHWLGRDTVLL
ncbi:hypothetical protein VaNZ11_008499 [Volvox africanus]|uniref:O-fucosyltransferase family protein n=1 Tax=Volvox africanus TaxID=51714 RepID=A0ABQ5S598_9CHLO|nr:hypothetical protein VaNZ11_008499 [Volvox africanus]